GGYYDLNKDITTGPSLIPSDTWHGSSYLYSHIRYPAQFSWTLGASFDSLHDDLLGDFNQVNPKFGAMWNVTPETSLRLAVFRTLKRSLLTDQTTEPTQVAGFNQFFDDPNGTESRRYGIALDQKFFENL